MTDPGYLGWSDNHPKTTDAQRVTAAIRRYTDKHGTQPTVVLVHPQQYPEQLPMEAAGMDVRRETWMALGTVLVRKEEQA